MENVDRFISPIQDKYVFLAPSGETLQYMGISPNVQVVGTENLPLYTFVYIDGVNTLHQIDVNKDLQVIYLDGILQVEPFLEIAYSFKEIKLSLAISVNDPEAKYEYAAPVHISENQNMGTINETNYSKLEEIWKTRLMGAINLRFVRDENGLIAVEACVVNKGVVPDWS